MHNTLKTKAVLGCSVKAISETAAGMVVTTTCLNPPSSPLPSVFAAVISTVSLSCLSVMDLTGCNIPGGNGDNYSQWAAMRQLQYGPSIKIGIKFTAPWWGSGSFLGGPIEGGQSYTDLPIRTMYVSLVCEVYTYADEGYLACTHHIRQTLRLIRSPQYSS
jgi:monoamine oxidase